MAGILKFKHSTSPDLKVYRVRFALNNQALDYSVPYWEVGKSVVQIKLDDIFPKIIFGDFTVLLSAVDTAGNESDLLNCGIYLRRK